jgi:hypothetical protein
VKNFKEYVKEEMTTTVDAGIPQDTANMQPKKKKRTSITRRYIEVNGVRRLQMKTSR